MGLCPVSAVTQEHSENPTAFLERLKEALQKFTNLYLDSYEGRVILKDKFLLQCASDIRIKLQQLQQQDPPASWNEMVQTATNILCSREQEREDKAQEREKRKETRHAQILATLQANPESLKDKAQGKCLICSQVGHWAKECPNCDKSPKMDCYKCHQLGHWVALCPGDPRASRSSTKPSFRVVQQYWSGLLHPAHLSQITNMGLEPRVKLDVAGRSENFLVDTGATYSVLTSYSGAFSSQACTILSATGKTITKIFTWARLCCCDGQIFPHQFLVIPECPTPLLGRNISLSSKSCSFWSPDRRCFKTLFWGKTIFTSPQVKQLLNGTGHLWVSDSSDIK